MMRWYSTNECHHPTAFGGGTYRSNSRLSSKIPAIAIYNPHGKITVNNREFVRGEPQMDPRELTILLRDRDSATNRLLSAWADVPMLLMMDEDWERGPFVIVGLSDRMLWPMIPPGSLLRLNTKARKIQDGAWPEFERPIYLIEYKDRFHCCHAQRRGDMLRMISHLESPAPPSISVPYKEIRVRGQLTVVFRPLATRGSLAGRPQRTYPGI